MATGWGDLNAAAGAIRVPRSVAREFRPVSTTLSLRPPTFHHSLRFNRAVHHRHHRGVAEHTVTKVLYRGILGISRVRRRHRIRSRLTDCPLRSDVRPPSRLSVVPARSRARAHAVGPLSHLPAPTFTGFTVRSRVLRCVASSVGAAREGVAMTQPMTPDARPVLNDSGLDPARFLPSAAGSADPMTSASTRVAGSPQAAPPTLRPFVDGADEGTCSI